MVIAPVRAGVFRSPLVCWLLCAVGLLARERPRVEIRGGDASALRRPPRRWRAGPRGRLIPATRHGGVLGRLPGNLDAGRRDQVDITAFSPATRNARVVGAVRAPALRRDLVAAWPGDRFATVVSLAAYVDPSCTIGAGTVIVPGAVLTIDVVVGEHCQVNIGETLSHDVHLASFVTIGPGTVLADLMTPNAVVAGVPASVVKVRDGWLDAL
jgi:hypothetical protein